MWVPPLGAGYRMHNQILYRLSYPYEIDWNVLPTEFVLGDHLNGFDENLDNDLLTRLDQHAASRGFVYDIHVDQPSLSVLKQKYHNLNFILDFAVFKAYSPWTKFQDYRIHPELKLQNFICSFNGSPHVGRKLLVASLQRFGWFDHNHCSKNFDFTVDTLDGHLRDLVGHDIAFYRKFFISDSSETFFKSRNSFGYDRFNHKGNIRNLESIITKNFLHIVSETMPTSYHPFVTEKFLYSVVTRGLFIAYAQPGWHDHICRYYGFRRHDHLFDYRFDSLQNPVQRLIELICMLSKFYVLDPKEWHDLYLLEQENIEYNYDHYFSLDYLNHMRRYTYTAGNVS